MMKAAKWPRGRFKCCSHSAAAAGGTKGAALPPDLRREPGVPLCIACMFKYTAGPRNPPVGASPTGENAPALDPPGMFGMELPLGGRTRAGLRRIILEGIGSRLREGQITRVVRVGSGRGEGAVLGHAASVGCRANAIQARETPKLFTARERLTQ